MKWFSRNADGATGPCTIVVVDEVEKLGRRMG
jgi:hypothetical protein